MKTYVMKQVLEITMHSVITVQQNVIGPVVPI